MSLDDGAARVAAKALDAFTVDELYDGAPSGYVSLLPGGEILRVNQTFLDWTAFTRDDLVGARRFQDLLTPGGRIFYETHCQPLLMIEGVVREITLDVCGADGHRMPVLFGAETLRREDGEPGLIRATIFDNSQRRSYERALLASRDAERLAREHSDALRSLTDAVVAATSIKAIDEAVVRELLARPAIASVEIVRPPSPHSPSFTVDGTGALLGGEIPVRVATEPPTGTLRFSIGAESKNGDQERAMLIEAAAIAGRGVARIARLIAFQRSASRRGDDGGLPNRRWWQAALASDIRQAARSRDPLTVAFLQIDGFDRYSQVHGHVAGDRLLLQVSDAWRRAGYDLLSREGGEEFAAIMPGLDRTAALALIGSLRRTPGMKAAFSVGIAELKPGDGPAEMAARAEAALDRDRALRGTKPRLA